jgi:hypothetical protein
VTNWANDRLYTLQGNKWKLFSKQHAFEVAVAKNGKVFIRSAANEILML